MKKIVAVIFLSLVFFLASGTFYSFFRVYREYIGEFHGMENLVSALTFRDCGTKVPQPAGSLSLQTTGESGAAKQSIISSAAKFFSEKSQFFRKITYNIEDMYTRYFYGLDFFVDGHGLFCKLLAKCVVYVSVDSGFYRSPNNILYEIKRTPLKSDYSDFEPTDSMRESIEKIKNLKNILDQKGIELLYIYPMLKGYPAIEELISGTAYLETDQGKGEYWFTSELKKNRIPTICGSEELARLGISYEDYFYRTDHHWRHEAVFAWMPEVLDALHLLPTEDLQKFRIEDYFNVVSRESFFVGSTGRNVGSFFCRPDDFTWFIPKENYDLHIDYIHRVTHENKSCEGKFDEVMVTAKNIDPAHRYANRYGVYLGVDRPKESIHNKDIQNHRKIILVKTSYAAPIIGYLCCFAEDVIILDFRHLRPDEGTLQEFVEREKPDTVVIVCPAHSIASVRF